MAPLLFILIIVLLFATLLTYETASDATQPRLQPLGLFTWLVSGNWPAKVGAGLIILGVGALLRYALINIDVPPEMKLGSGVIISAVLGFASMALKSKPKRRAIHLALAGAAFGIAYLTAYSAYGFFGYINDVNALALLALTAMAAGVFAVTSNAMSVAILAMVGAYVAPKFAIGTPGVLPVYGYYLAASILSLIMVTMRGWRPLIHLSFLFTLAGALFFGWSGKFYEPEHYAAMQPLLLALTAVHLAMPLLERRHLRSAWVARFDAGYFALLPMVAAALTLKIAPNLHTEGAFGLGALALIWGGAAAILSALKKSEASRHAAIAALLAVAAIFCFVHDLPWLLVGLGLSVAAMSAAPKLGWSRNSQEVLCGVAVLFGTLHMINSLIDSALAPAFVNELFARRMIGGALMAFGGGIGLRQSITFARILGIIGLGWIGLSILTELLHLHLDFLPQLVYGLILGATLLTIMFAEKTAAHPVVGGMLIFALIGCGWWAVHDASQPVTFAYFLMTPVALLGMAWTGRNAHGGDSDFSPSIAIGLLPFAMLPWASGTAEIAGITTDFFEAAIAMAAIAAAGLSARLWLADSPRWNRRIQPLHVYFTVFSLLYVTLFHIERGVWPVVFEVLALAYLIAYVTRRSRESSPPGAWLGAVMVVSAALVLQAMLLRGFGPAGIMDASDINKMHLPAVISLMWAVFGGGLAWWATRIKSRPLWSAGSVLLVAAAIKLVLFDFGTLGQLGNILAFIAAGVVFLGVAWFAPIPPKAEPASPPATEPQQQKNQQQPSQPSQVDRPARAATSVESQGINGLWFVLVGFAIVIALISSAWNKQARRNLELQKYRQGITQSVENVRQTAGNAAPPVEMPAPAAVVADER